MTPPQYHPLFKPMHILDDETDAKKYHQDCLRLCVVQNERYNTDPVLRELNSSHGTNNCVSLSTELISKLTKINHELRINIRYECACMFG